jgi:hypothetical protein
VCTPYAAQCCYLSTSVDLIPHKSSALTTDTVVATCVTVGRAYRSSRKAVHRSLRGQVIGPKHGAGTTLVITDIQVGGSVGGRLVYDHSRAQHSK